MTIAQNKRNTKPTQRKYTNNLRTGVTHDVSIGYCLECRGRVSRCGIAFSAEIVCPSCGAVNVYENSQQPDHLADAATRR